MRRYEKLRYEAGFMMHRLIDEPNFSRDYFVFFWGGVNERVSSCQNEIINNNYYLLKDALV